MKKFLLLAGVGLLIMSFKPQDDVDGLIRSLKAGNAGDVAAYFDSFIDLTIPGKDEIKNVGRSQATIVLKSFFDENGIKGFDASSQREAGPTMYITVKLTGKNMAYNITIFLKKKDDKHQIIKVRINQTS